MVNINDALWITAVGMSIVFAVIILLWALIILIVRISGGIARRPAEAQQEEETNVLRAAAAAVALALVLHKSSPELHEFPLPPTATVSPWQSVMRTKILTKRGPTR